MGHTGRVADVVVSPDGHTLATIGADGAARLWDAATRREVAILTIQPDPVATAAINSRRVAAALAFSPDGRTVATAAADGTAARKRALPSLLLVTSSRPSGLNATTPGPLVVAGVRLADRLARADSGHLMPDWLHPATTG